MYMRLLQTRVDPELVAGFKKLYDERIIPALQNLPGCFGATLVKNDQGLDEYLSMTLWDMTPVLLTDVYTSKPSF